MSFNLHIQIFPFIWTIFKSITFGLDISYFLSVRL